MNKKWIADISLLLVALVWGTTFVIVQNAIAILPPHSFNGIRFTMASIALFLIILLFDRKIIKMLDKKIVGAGIILGIMLFGGYAFQTTGLLYTTASNAGFITGLSVVLVPIMSIFILKIIPKWPTILGVALATLGLYLLTMVGNASFELGDLLVLFCAVFFALQIVFTGKYAPNFNSLLLAWVQVTVVAILSIVFAMFGENFITYIQPEILFNKNIIIALIITAIFATALAFLAQTVFQKYTTPTRVAIIFAMEPVFSALTSLVVLNETLTKSALIGGGMIFIGMILAELPPDSLSFIIKREVKKNPL